MLRRKPLKRKASLKARKPIPKKNKKRADANYLWTLPRSGEDA